MDNITYNGIAEGLTIGSNSFISGSGTTAGNWVWQNPSTVQNVDKKKITVLTKVKLFGITIKRKFTDISTDEFFNRVKKDRLKLKIIDKILEKYLANIARAEMAGQVALVEKLKDNVGIVKKETEMAIAGIDTYLSKKQFETLLSKTTKHITETPIRNYTQFIPDKIITKIADLKSKNIFNEFVIVHYDPKKENSALTKEEKRRKEDPIAFGKINGSDKYYFIGDWIDDYCNLTLTEAVEIIGSKAEKLI
jgi:hypothetical protein